MSVQRTSIFLTGATGYIGGSVLARLLSHPRASTFDIHVLVRSPEKADILMSMFGVTAVIGTHGDLDKVYDLVEQAQVIFHCADADNEDMIKAILSAMKERHNKTGELSVLIHTSGTGELTDDARGEYATENVYSDLNVEQIKSIPDTALHRNVDLRIIDADNNHYARCYIVLPSTIYGMATHALVKAGVSNAHSNQIPALIKAALARKRAGVVGKGKALWPDVHIDDIVELYMVIFDSQANNPDATGHGWEGYYFGENGEHSWYQISEAIGEALVELGITNDAEPTTFTVEELIQYFGDEATGWYSGTNSRCRSDRGRVIGWKPKYTMEDMLKSIKPEIEALLKRQAGKA